MIVGLASKLMSNTQYKFLKSEKFEVCYGCSLFSINMYNRFKLESFKKRILSGALVLVGYKNMFNLF